MSQEQPRRPQDQEWGIKYGDVFEVSGELATKNIAPRDAAAMQSAETRVLDQTQRGGPAAVMQSAADVNESLGVVGHDEASDITKDQGVTITEGVIGGRRLVSEAVGGEVIGGYATTRSSTAVGGGITIGEALEAAEARATGRGPVMPGGIGAEAQAGANANLNPWTRDQDKTNLGDVLKDATDRLPGGKPVSRDDADRVVTAEARNDPRATPHPGGVVWLLPWQLPRGLMRGQTPHENNTNA